MDSKDINISTTIQVDFDSDLIIALFLFFEVRAVNMSNS